jgi:hypothetical protein
MPVDLRSPVEPFPAPSGGQPTDEDTNRSPQFSLRTLLLAVALTALCCGLARSFGWAAVLYFGFATGTALGIHFAAPSSRTIISGAAVGGALGTLISALFLSLSATLALIARSEQMDAIATLLIPTSVLSVTVLAAIGGALVGVLVNASIALARLRSKRAGPQRTRALAAALFWLTVGLGIVWIAAGLITWPAE